MRKEPAHYIQNHINWCWAAAAKIVGLRYCQDNQCEYDINKGMELRGTVREDTTGLRRQYIGWNRGRILVDSWQWDIVLHAKNQTENADGNQPEDDEAKIRALRYVVTGDIWNQAVQILNYGYYQSNVSLLDSHGEEILAAAALGRCMIGNYLKSDGQFHSIVLMPCQNNLLLLYDPWDGCSFQFTFNQIFRSGFLTNQGYGVILWIQYIK